MFTPKVHDGATLGVSMAGAIRTQDEIRLLDKGEWLSETSLQLEPDAQAYGFWLDAKVKNLSVTKLVAVVWSDDNWLTAIESPLHYRRALSDGFELWSVDINPIGTSHSRHPKRWSNRITGNGRVDSACGEIALYLKYQVKNRVFYDANFGQYYRHKFGR